MIVSQDEKDSSSKLSRIPGAAQYVQKVLRNIEQYKLYPSEQFENYTIGILATTSMDTQGDSLTLNALQAITEHVTRQTFWVTVKHNPLYAPVGRIISTKVFYSLEDNIYVMVGISGIFTENPYIPFVNYNIDRWQTHSIVTLVKAPTGLDEEDLWVIIAYNKHEISDEFIDGLLKAAPDIVLQETEAHFRKSFDPLKFLTICTSLWHLATEPIAVKLLGLYIRGKNWSEQLKDFRNWLKHTVFPKVKENQAPTNFQFEARHRVSSNNDEIIRILFVVESSDLDYLNDALDNLSAAAQHALQVIEKVKYFEIERIVYKFEPSHNKWHLLYIVTNKIGIISEEKRTDFSGEGFSLSGAITSSRRNTVYRVSDEKELKKIQNMIDLAIITVLPEEYHAVYQRLQNVQKISLGKGGVNTFSWIIGEIESQFEGHAYKVVLAMASRAGGSSGTITTLKTIEKWKPRYVLIVGIAGGLPRDNLLQGDVVLSEVIWGYEYGKIDHGFQPRLNNTHPIDGALLRSAEVFGAMPSTRWRSQIILDAPRENHIPKVITGAIASGDKVIDNKSDDFFQQVIGKWPQIQAVEMEGAGVAPAIAAVNEEGLSVGFFMIRGISDMPKDGIQTETTDEVAVSHQTQERDLWKLYAANVAAAFAVDWISNNWPMEPHSLHE